MRDRTTRARAYRAVRCGIGPVAAALDMRRDDRGDRQSEDDGDRRGDDRRPAVIPADQAHLATPRGVTAPYTQSMIARLPSGPPGGGSPRRRCNRISVMGAAG